MTLMDWFRHYDGACFDPKFRTAARRAETSIEFAVFVFWALCEYASSQPERGSIEGFDLETTADHLGCNVSNVTRVFHAFHGVFHDNEKLINWSKRQYNSDHSTERVRAWRERKKSEATKRNVTKRSRNVAKRQNRTEQNIDSVAIATGASAPNGSAVKDLDALLFERGKALLGKNAGGQINRLKQQHGVPGVLDLIEQASRKENPSEWIAGVINQPRKPRDADRGIVAAGLRAQRAFIGEG